MSHKAVLDILGVDGLDTLVADSFLDVYGLNLPGQYGMVCRDVEQNIGKLQKAGTRPFLHANTKGPNWVEWGEAKDVKVEMALGYSNHQQIELLGPGENTDFYLDKIPDDDSLALHHVCIFQLGIEDLEEALNADGFETALSGNISIGNFYSTNFRYFDTRKELGFFLEITEYKLLGRHSPPGEKLISALGKIQQRFR